jgi:hypothetical protein
MKWRFAGKFLLTFTVLLVVWWRCDVATRYRGAALATVQAASPVVNCWWLDYDRPGLSTGAVFRRNDRELPMLLQLPALSMGLMPFLSLVVATPGLGWRRAGGTALVGALLYFLVDVLVVLVYPPIMDRPGLITDTLGVFSGLVAFVVAPLGLWFVLTYPALRSVWQLGGQSK